MAKRRISLLEKTEQPIRWDRAFWSGVLGAVMMMSFVDIFFMMGLTPFSYEQYLGSLLRGTAYGHQNWIVGLLGNGLMGGIFGFVYAWAFEWIFKASNTRLGAFLGLAHAAIAALAIFPFFGVLHTESGTEIFPVSFGFLGFGLGASTPILLLTGHLLFGATVGLLYGPVRAFRVRARVFEPGESTFPGEEEVSPESERAS